jgi:hypothetical protein
MKRREKMKKFIPLVLLFSAALASCGGPILADAANDYYVTGNFAGWGDATEAAGTDGVKTFLMEAVSVNDSRVASVKSAFRNPEFLYVKQIVLPSTAAGWDVKYVRTQGGAEQTFDGNLTVKVIQTNSGAVAPNYWAQNPESGVVNNLTPSTLYIPPFVETAPYTGSGTWNDNPVALTAGTYTLVFGSQVFEGDTLAELFMGLVAVTA